MRKCSQSRVEVDERGRASVPLGTLGGKPVVAAMGYTSCKDMCPAIVANMIWIEKHLPQDAAKRVTFAFFSINSAIDTPTKLMAYADEHGLDPATWTLFHGDDDAGRELAAALGVGYRTDGQGGFDHAVVISLIDEKGEIVVQQRGTQASSDELLTALIACWRSPTTRSRPKLHRASTTATLPARDNMKQLKFAPRSRRFGRQRRARSG